jgi:hypothetical protein
MRAVSGVQLFAYDPVQKYGTPQVWGQQIVRRLRSWGFNALGQYTSTSPAVPVGAWGGRTHNPERMPLVMFVGGLSDALDNPSSMGLPERVKSLLEGVPRSTYGGYRAHFPDVYDPKLRVAIKNTVAYWNRAFTGGFASQPWIIGLVMDDADYMYGVKSRGGAPVNAYPDVAFLVACARFDFRDIAKKDLIGYRATPYAVDTRFHTKYAWIAFLKAKYQNSIDALNRAWRTGGFYTSFDDAGGYGVGTGVLDEDGRHTAWMGTMKYPYTNTGASPGVQADLNTFLHQLIRDLATIYVSEIRAVDRNHLILSPMLNNYGARARDEVLRGFADAGVDLFQLNDDPTRTGLSGGMAENNQTYDLTGKPAYLWYGIASNRDSDLRGLTVPYGTTDFPTQEARGLHYRDVAMPAVLGARGANGDAYAVGLDYWALWSKPSEGYGSGLVTAKDNAFDGREARRAAGKDAGGFPVGGESQDYGDFLTAVKEAHAAIDKALRTELARDARPPKR